MDITVVGAGWAHGGLPPWMEQPPWFDEAAAADREQDAAALAAALRAEQLPADLLAERFGSLTVLSAERGRLPRPPTLAELAARRGSAATPADDYARRRAVLNAALDPTDHLATDYGRAA